MKASKIGLVTSPLSNPEINKATGTCNTTQCPTQECTEVFKSDCVLYTGPDLSCQNTTVVNTDDTVTEAIQSVVGYFCANGGGGGVGPQGATGSQGVQGVQGVQGTQGVQGKIGTQGSQGPQGTQGIQGLRGIQGSQGIQGIQGVQGPRGIQGSQGIQGSPGIQGAKGVNGLQGAQGTQGIPGEFAAQGVQGTQGTQGTQGVQGSRGLQGSTGEQGGYGPSGAQGAQGVQGGGFNQAQGSQGTQGSAGYIGADGAQGAQGSTGAGAQGAQGTQGTQGTQGPLGEGAQGAQGVQGIQGSLGAQGIIGAGSQGAQGVQGALGPCCQGAQGTSGEIAGTNLQKTLFVDLNGSLLGPEIGNIYKPWPTVYDAFSYLVTNSLSGYTIHVFAGTYIEPGAIDNSTFLVNMVLNIFLEPGVILTYPTGGPYIRYYNVNKDFALNITGSGSHGGLLGSQIQVDEDLIVLGDMQKSAEFTMQNLRVVRKTSNTTKVLIYMTPNNDTYVNFQNCSFILDEDRHGFVEFTGPEIGYLNFIMRDCYVQSAINIEKTKSVITTNNNNEVVPNYTMQINDCIFKDLADDSDDLGFIYTEGTASAFSNYIILTDTYFWSANNVIGGMATFENGITGTMYITSKNSITNTPDLINVGSNPVDNVCFGVDAITRCEDIYQPYE